LYLLFAVGKVRLSRSTDRLVDAMLFLIKLTSPGPSFTHVCYFYFNFFFFVTAKMYVCMVNYLWRQCTAKELF